MLRKSDFCLSGNGQRLNDYEVKSLIRNIHNAVNTAVKFGLQNDYEEGMYYTAEQHYAGKYIGIRDALIILGIKVRYRDKELVLPQEIKLEVMKDMEEFNRKEVHST